MPRKRSPRLTEREKYRYLEQIEALIEKVERGPEIKKIEGSHVTIEGDRLLTIVERRYVAEVLRQHWLPKRELRAIKRQRTLGNIEVFKAGAKRARKHAIDEAVASLMAGGDSHKVAMAKMRRARTSTAITAELATRVATGHGFKTTGAMEQFVKRERRAKKEK